MMTEKVEEIPAQVKGFFDGDTDSRPVMVTIRCITYNHERYIRQALEGFLMQKTNFRFEAIVHDDASTDGTAAIIREYAEKYPDIIKPIYETENQYSKHNGMIRRVMNAVTRGKYIALCEEMIFG
jgi:glycosyltransferase involved in cell wall biosynthesis